MPYVILLVVVVWYPTVVVPNVGHSSDPAMSAEWHDQEQLSQFSRVTKGAFL